MEAKKQTVLLNASNLIGADKAKALYSAGLTEEAAAATRSLQSLSAGTPAGSIVNSGGVPVRVTSNKVRRVSRGGVSGFFGQTDKIREIYGENLYTGEHVLLFRDNLSA